MNRIATPPAPIRRAVPVQEATSPGGIGFWLVENYSVPVVALEFSFEGGATQDPAGLDGATTMMAGLLDEGAGPYDSQDFQRELDSKAIEMSFSADRDHVGGRLRTLAREVDRAFELLGLALHAARFDSEPVERVRQQAMAGLRHEANDPDAVAGRAWRALAYPGHAYGRERQGTLESLPKVGRADVMALRDALFSRDGLKLSVVGAIDALRAGRLVDA
ncbi:MAG: insulinase family protein, partial [Hyphomicrobiales bacterium]|nr:insulinase family protein [Hyphomicrobiales bacterium]